MNEKGWGAKLIEYLERTLPNIIAAFMAGFKLGEAGKNKVQAKLDQTETQLELTENELQNKNEFSGKSSDDIVRGAIESKRVGTKKPDSR